MDLIHIILLTTVLGPICVQMESQTVTNYDDKTATRDESEYRRHFGPGKGRKYEGGHRYDGGEDDNREDYYKFRTDKEDDDDSEENSKDGNVFGSGSKSETSKEGKYSYGKGSKTWSGKGAESNKGSKGKGKGFSKENGKGSSRGKWKWGNHRHHGGTDKKVGTSDSEEGGNDENAVDGGDNRHDWSIDETSGEYDSGSREDSEDGHSGESFHIKHNKEYDPCYGYAIFNNFVAPVLGSIYQIEEHRLHVTYVKEFRDKTRLVMYIATENYHHWVTRRLFDKNSSSLFLTYDRNNTIGQFAAGSGFVLLISQNNTMKFYVCGTQGRSWKPIDATVTGFHAGDMPTVWNDPENMWYTVEISSLTIETSPNLKDWMRRGPLRIGSPSSFSPNEIFSLQLSWEGAFSYYWIVTAIETSQDNSKRLVYFLGSLENGVFVVSQGPLHFDFTTTLGRISVASDGNWIQPWRIMLRTVINPLPVGSLDIGWLDVMTVARNITLVRNSGGQYWLRQMPLPFQMAGRLHRVVAGTMVRPGMNPLSRVEGISFDLSATLTGSSSVEEVFFRLRMKGEEYVEVGYDFRSHEFYVNTERLESPNGNGCPDGRSNDHRAQFDLVDRVVRFRILMDVSTLEVFGHFGEIVFSTIVFSNRDHRHMELGVVGDAVIIEMLQINVVA